MKLILMRAGALVGLVVVTTAGCLAFLMFGAQSEAPGEIARTHAGASQMLVPRGSEKPSFDCAKAKTAAARLICADAELARLDSELGVALRKRTAQISVPDRSNFVAEQVAWLRDRNTRCDLDGKNSAAIEVLAGAKPCMVKAIRERIAFLAQIHATTGPAIAPSARSALADEPNDFTLSPKCAEAERRADAEAHRSGPKDFDTLFPECVESEWRVWIVQHRPIALAEATAAEDKAFHALADCTLTQAANLMVTNETAEAVAAAAFAVCKLDLENAARAAQYTTDLELWFDGPQPRPNLSPNVELEQRIIAKVLPRLAATIMQSRAETARAPRPQTSGAGTTLPDVDTLLPPQIEQAYQGNASAQWFFGSMYADGRDVPQDFVQAYMWFNLAAAQGFQAAVKDRDLIAQRMTPAQIAEAQKLAREWRPKIANAQPEQSAPQPPFEKPESGATSGTAFFVSKGGMALTNSHVVEHCRQIRVQSGTQNGTARLVARDDNDDLALLATDLHPASAPNWRLSVRQGEDIVVFGFPLAGVLATTGNVAVGNVTALAGLGDDSRYLQISAPVQPGNSGGPLLDRNGNVVGIVVAQLDALKIAAAIGDIPQNINFAIKASAAAAFLDAQHVLHAEDAGSLALSTPDIAEYAKELTMRVVCVR